jgi:hypothetical protein
VDLFRLCGLFPLAARGFGGAPLAPPAGSGAEPQLEARGSGVSVLSSPVGSGAEPQPSTHFGEFWREFYAIPSYLK